MLCCRRISAIRTPASPCFRMPTIWLSVNRDFRMGISLAPESLPSNCLPGGEAYGVIKVFLVESLLRRRLWAYPTGIVFFALFIVYQMYRYYLHPSIEMLVLSILDLIVIVLTWLEYRQLKRGEHDVWGVPSRRRCR